MTLFLCKLDNFENARNSEKLQEFEKREYPRWYIQENTGIFAE